MCVEFATPDALLERVSDGKTAGTAGDATVPPYGARGHAAHVGIAHHGH